jgi:hypothetical protein
MSSRAFVLGNGRSRIGAKIKKLKKRGTVYGCNALYREFEPDFLIAVDPKMIFEICDKEWQLTHQVWTNPNSRYSKYKGLNFFKNPKGWSSGPTALHKAVIDGYREIYILGFDYYGVDNRHFNNVYADTQNYKKSSDTATYYGNWMRQTETIIKEFRDIYFYRVIGPETQIISEWSQLNNLRQITYQEMYDRIG